MDNTNAECKPESGNLINEKVESKMDAMVRILTNIEQKISESKKVDDTNDDIGSLIVEETRQSFLRLESLMMNLDLKSSIIIAIDAILMSSLDLTTLFKDQISILRFLIVLPLFISIVFAFCCLWPRGWKGPTGTSTINECANIDFYRASCMLAGTYAKDWEINLAEVYRGKFECFEKSVVFTMISLVIIFAFFFGYIFTS